MNMQPCHYVVGKVSLPNGSSMLFFLLFLLLLQCAHVCFLQIWLRCAGQTWQNMRQSSCGTRHGSGKMVHTSSLALSRFLSQLYLLSANTTQQMARVVACTACGLQQARQGWEAAPNRWCVYLVACRSWLTAACVFARLAWET